MNKKKLSDIELLNSYKNRSLSKEQIFKEILVRYKTYVFNIGLVKLNNKQDAEDAAQETFIRIYYALENFKMEASLKTWISVIAGNVCITMLLTEKRKFWKYNVISSTEADLENIYNLLTSKQQEFTFWKKIGEILHKMNFLYRKVFILKYFKNKLLLEIAKKIETSIAATKMKIKRAREQFIKIFIKG